MGREQMRNLETFRIGGTQVNEFEYQKNQGEMTEQLEQHPDEAAGTKRPTQAERVERIMAEAHRKVEKRRKKGASKAGQSKKTTTVGTPKGGASGKARIESVTGAAAGDETAKNSASKKRVSPRSRNATKK